MNEHKSNTYRVDQFRTPDGAPADIVIFTITSESKSGIKKQLPHRELKVLLIKRNQWPFEGKWALPGGFTHPFEDIYTAAQRELLEETGVSNVHMELIDVYSSPDRDPRGWMISTAYFALVQERLLTLISSNDEVSGVQLFPLDEVLHDLDLAFDHRTIIRDAYLKVKQKMLQTTIAKEFLPEAFTLSELYQVIKTVVPEFEEDNFIRKLKATERRKGLIEEVLDEHGQPRTSNQYSQRAAQLYKFTDYVPDISIYK